MHRNREQRTGLEFSEYSPQAVVACRNINTIKHFDSESIMGRLNGKVCLITGGARGQGAEEARLFAQEGAIVWLSDVLESEGEAIAADIGGLFKVHDVTDPDDWSDLIEEILAEHQRIDVLINNAGIFRTGRHYEIDLDEFQAVMEVNSTGVFLGMRAVAPAMREAGSGSIVNISSVAGLGATPGAFAYGASKWAVRGMTKTAAVELGRRGIRVNSIHPGLIETEMLKQLPGSDEQGKLTQRIPLGRVADAKEVAAMALFLASDESSYSSGAEFVIDGGLTALP